MVAHHTLDGKGHGGFGVGEYDTARPLVIDPVLVYSTYFGGLDRDRVRSIDVDGSGNAYLTGETRSADFPIANAQESEFSGASDAFVTKINAAGDTLLYSTYLGGFSAGHDIVVDELGNVYVTGWTTSEDFPTTPGAFQIKLNQDIFGCVGCKDAFVAKLSPTGRLVYSTLLGGAVDDLGNAIAIDALGTAYVTGDTLSEDFPTTAGAFQRQRGLASVCGNCQDAFVAKVSPNGDFLLYSTYLGGNGQDLGNGIAIDSNGNAYVTGFTDSNEISFPITLGAFQTVAKRTGTTRLVQNAFVSKLSADGSSLVYSTYLSGTARDCGVDIAVDQDGNAYLTGETRSADFPITPGSFNESAAGNPVRDAFVTKLNPTGTDLVYSGSLGGHRQDDGTGIVVDRAGNAYITGNTASTDFPVTPELCTAGAPGEG